MWYGKISIIMYIFSLGLLFSSYYINQVFNDPVVSQSVTFTSLQSIMGTFQPNTQINSALIFGDFINTWTLLGGLITGSVFTSSLTIISNTGFADLSVGLLMG